ncbi:MAG: hypothetical protein ACLTBV_26915 [Enterocloster bolteae]
MGISDVMELYEEIPEAIRYQGALNLPEAIPDEQGIKRHIERILSKNKNCNEFSNFMGAGCAQHYVPAVCDEIASRGELLTTYGAETWADHGKYQIFFEYQSLMAELLDMSFLTVPCHCGGQASATGLRMACPYHRKEQGPPSPYHEPSEPGSGAQLPENDRIRTRKLRLNW